MAIARLSGLGGAAAVINTSPKLSPCHSGSPHFRLLEALGAPVELDAEFWTILLLLRKLARFWPRFFPLPDLCFLQVRWVWFCSLSSSTVMKKIGKEKTNIFRWISFSKMSDVQTERGSRPSYLAFSPHFYPLPFCNYQNQSVFLRCSKLFSLTHFDRNPTLGMRFQRKLSWTYSFFFWCLIALSSVKSIVVGC